MFLLFGKKFVKYLCFFVSNLSFMNLEFTVEMLQINNLGTQVLVVIQ